MADNSKKASEQEFLNKYMNILDRKRPNENRIFFRKADFNFLRDFNPQVKYSVLSQFMEGDLFEKAKNAAKKSETICLTKRIKYEAGYNCITISVGTNNGDCNPGRIVLVTNPDLSKIISSDNFADHLGTGHVEY